MKNNKGFSIISLLLAIVIIFLVYNFVIKGFLSTSAMDKGTQKALKEQGIDTSDVRTMINKTQETVDEVNKKMRAREKELRDLAE